ncbi:MAG TPA: radical SAM protein [Bacteroidales bacterium]|nr:radical SAM protein [Bacteroidales bacterium]HPS62572.1 radical SAM protein [Bacteroidales bacterium]
MHIGLIFPNKDRRYKTVHLGLGYLAAYARLRHPETTFHLLDTRVATRKESRKFFSGSFDLVAMTVFSPVYSETRSILERLRNEMPQTPVCLGGPYVTTIGGEIFSETPAEYAIIGEGEITFSELITCLKGEKQRTDIAGLMFRDENDAIVINPPREQIADLDSLPFPAYDLFPMDRYPLHRMVTTRGCPYGCAWCNSSSIWGRTYRSRSPENIVAEIEFLLNRYGQKIFVFGDNSFNIEAARVGALCDLLIRKDIRILWSASVRADLMTLDLAHKMKAAGCYNAAIGVESADNELLARMHKNTTIEAIAAGMTMLKNAGIEVLAQYVIGTPGETLETVKRSVEFARRSCADYTNFYMVLPFRGTPQWDYVMDHGTLYTKKIHDFHRINPRIVFETPEFTYQDRLEAIRLVKKNGFYSNKDKKSILFDMAKDFSRWVRNILPQGAGDKVFMLLKSVYRLREIKKNNI